MLFKSVDIVTKFYRCVTFSFDLGNVKKRRK